MKHTPGPWRYQGYIILADVAHEEDPDEWMHFTTNGLVVAESVSEKNRPLIAAAPELYAELKRREWCKSLFGPTYCTVCGQSKKDGHRQDCPTGIAISKAEGGTE